MNMLKICHEIVIKFLENLANERSINEDRDSIIYTYKNCKKLCSVTTNSKSFDY